MCSDFVVALELTTSDCVKRWHSIVGPTDANVKAESFFYTISKLEGKRRIQSERYSLKEGSRTSSMAVITVNLYSLAYGLHTALLAQKEIDFFFSQRSPLKVVIREKP